MVCSFVDPETIKEWIEICQLMKTLDKMVCFKFTPTELNIQIIHPSKRCVVDMKFPSTWFSNYEWKESEFYIPSESLYTIFSLYSGEKLITMESANKFMNIKFFHDNQTKNFSIPLHSYSHRDIVIENEKGVQFIMETNYIYPLCKELYTFGNMLFFNIKNDFFHMISYGKEKMVVEIHPNSVEIITRGDYEKSYELEYLLIFLKFSKVYSKVTINLNKILHASIKKEYTIQFYLSPMKS